MLTVPLSRNQILRHDELLECIDRYGIQSANSISAAKDELLHNIEKQQEAIKPICDLLSAESAAHSAKLEELLNQQSKVSAYLSEDRRRRRCQAILDGLHFDGIDHRKEAISDASDGTFEWVFDDDEEFGSWLAHGEDLFCLFGKAGSGKSTLMRFLADDPRTRELLEQWASGSTLVTAEHYFWYPGRDMQKSHLGLLRGLLFKIISTDPHLACFLCPDRWNNDGQRFQTPWTRQTLLQSLKNLQHLKDTKVFLLVDGLDEYCPQENHRTLLQDLRALLGIPNLKICVSSRPWSEFELEFRDSPTMRLEDHNLEDIKQHASVEIEHAVSRAKRIDLETLNPEEKLELVAEVARHAKGVFLWVFLAVRALADRIKAGMDLAQLWGFLEDFPKDLDEYFREMIYKRISDTWREKSETAQALKLAMIAREGHFQNGSFISYWLLTTINTFDDERFAFNLRPRRVPLEEFQEMARKTKALLDRCARDLLQFDQYSENHYVTPPPGLGFVKFTHRSVLDFLMTAEMQELLERHTPPAFRRPDINSQLILARLKLIPDYMNSDRVFHHYTQVTFEFWNPFKQAPVAQDMLCEVDRVGLEYPLRLREWEDKDYAPSLVRSGLPGGGISSGCESGGHHTSVNELKTTASPAAKISRNPPDEDEGEELSQFPEGNYEYDSFLMLIGDALNRDVSNTNKIHSNEYEYANRQIFSQLSNALASLIGSGMTKTAFKALRESRAAELSEIVLMATLGTCEMYVTPRLAAAGVNRELLDAVLARDINLNKPTSPIHGTRRTVWDMFLRIWVRQAWERDFQPAPGQRLEEVRSSLPESDGKAWHVVRRLLEHGASTTGLCCVGRSYDCNTTSNILKHDCCLYPILDVLHVCTPVEFHGQLSELLALLSSIDRRAHKRKAKLITSM